MLNFQELCELVVKHRPLLKTKLHQLTIKQHIKTKVINTQDSSLPNYFTALYVLSAFFRLFMSVESGW